MIHQNIVWLSIRYVIIDLIGKILFFPIWWYTRGFKKMIKWAFRSIKDQEHALAVSVWLENLFVPMYGQYDWQGRIVSFFMRLVQIVFRLLFLLIWAVIVLIIVIFWLLLPFIIIYEIIFNIEAVLVQF